jgi:DedD protein
MNGADHDVTDSHEPSYYEIALTSRQVVVAFVILLACLLTAFFSGVWIGRESGVRAQEQLVRNAPPDQGQAPREGQALEEFEFFGSGEEERPAEPQPRKPEPARETTLLEDLGGDREAPSRPEPEPPARRAPEPEPQPEQRPAPARDQPRDQPREQPRQETREETPPPQAPAEPSASPAVASGAVVIQVFSSPEQAKAEQIRGRLSRAGHSAYMSPIEVAGRTMYRVRIGPFPSREDASPVAERIRKELKLDTWITTE